MGCNCGSRAGSKNTGSGSATSYSYVVTSPTGETKTFLTPLEAKKELRRFGGGTINRKAND